MLRLPAFAQSDMVASYTRKLTTADARSEYEFITKVILSKMAVDLAIEKVNAEGQNLLAQIEMLRECRDFANKITTNFQTSDNVERTWNSVTGVNDITKLEPVLCDLGDEIKTADKRIAELRDKLTADESSLADADEDATLARNAVAKARENFDRAASREERDEWRAKIPELEDKANAAATRAKEIRGRVDSTRAGIATWIGIANAKRGNAFRFRTAADNAAAKAQQVEVPEIRAALAATERRVAAAKEAERLRALRERLQRTVCRDCRFWEPFGDDPTRGPCHALPPSTGTGSNLSGAVLSEPHIVLATNWCGKGEPLPTADKSRKAAPVLA
jgi:hypothetical protein